jgi:hypothetical protein
MGGGEGVTLKKTLLTCLKDEGWVSYVPRSFLTACQRNTSSELRITGGETEVAFTVSHNEMFTVLQAAGWPHFERGKNLEAAASRSGEAVTVYTRQQGGSCRPVSRTLKRH